VFGEFGGIASRGYLEVYGLPSTLLQFYEYHNLESVIFILSAGLSQRAEKHKKRFPVRLEWIWMDK
jgi:hypothetical protein